MIQDLITNNINLDDGKKFAAIIGLNPSNGARSPLLWNAAYSYYNVDTRMLPLDVTANNLTKLLYELESNVDFIVPIKLQNIQNMINHSRDGKIDSSESWRILDVLFTPLTEVTLQTPVLAVNWRRKLAGVEDLTHVYLISPTNEEASKHTLIYVKGQWLVLKGLHGKPRRTYRMNPEQSLEYQKEIFSSMEKNSLWGWWKFSRFYKKWRKTCSVTHN